VGPEAALVCLIVCLYTFVNDRLEKSADRKNLLMLVGATAFITFIALNNVFGDPVHIARFGHAALGWNEFLWFVPVLFAGIGFGILYTSFDKAIGKATDLMKNSPLVLGIIGGAVLGICGILLPFTMFSGETQLTTLINNEETLTPFLYFMTGVVKLLLVAVCLRTGFRGGPIFPLLFCGLCLGFAFSGIVGTDLTFMACVLSAAVLTCVMRQPLAVSVILLLFFPVSSAPYIFAAAYLCLFVMKNIDRKHILRTELEI